MQAKDNYLRSLGTALSTQRWKEDSKEYLRVHGKGPAHSALNKSLLISARMPRFKIAMDKKLRAKKTGQYGNSITVGSNQNVLMFVILVLP